MGDWVRGQHRLPTDAHGQLVTFGDGRLLRQPVLEVGQGALQGGHVVLGGFVAGVEDRAVVHDEADICDDAHQDEEAEDPVAGPLAGLRVLVVWRAAVGGRRVRVLVHGLCAVWGGDCGGWVVGGLV